MSLYSKVGIAVDICDWPTISSYVDVIEENEHLDLLMNEVTVDNTYKIIYWDSIKWQGPKVIALVKALSKIRHSLIEITEEGQIIEDILIEDDNGVDEEFYEILSWNADVCLWTHGGPLAAEDDYPLMSRDRLISVLKSLIDNEAEVASETCYVYQDLVSSGLDDEEIEALGFGWLVPEE